jgi:hypothetical protein
MDLWAGNLVAPSELTGPRADGVSTRASHAGHGLDRQRSLPDGLLPAPIPPPHPPAPLTGHPERTFEEPRPPPAEQLAELHDRTTTSHLPASRYRSDPGKRLRVRWEPPMGERFDETHLKPQGGGPQRLEPFMLSTSAQRFYYETHRHLGSGSCPRTLVRQGFSASIDSEPESIRI